MAVATGTGLGGTISTLGMGLTVGNWEYISISGYEESVAVLDDTHLGSTTFEESIPASLASIAEITVQVYWKYDESAAVFADGTLLVADVGTLSINLPTRTGVSSGQLTGTAFITNIKTPDHTSGERSIGSFTFKFDGKTGPSYSSHA